MIKKKAKGKKAKKSAKKKSAVKKQKELHPAEVRQNISRMVEANAEGIAQAVIDEGMKGQVSTAKYLFEVAGIFPKPPEGEQGTTEEDSLARTLLHRLNLPEEPIDLDNPPVLEQKLLGSGEAANSDQLLSAENSEDNEKS